MNDKERLVQIRRANASAKPKDSNPAWKNTHHDLSFVLSYIDKAINEEREACAKIADEAIASIVICNSVTKAHNYVAKEIASAIRARGQQ